MPFSRRSRANWTSQRIASVRAALRHLDGHLVVGAADAAERTSSTGVTVLTACLERLDGRLAGLLGDDRERVVDEPLGRRALAVEHDGVDQLLGHELRP